ncbi:hypothetical protein LguiB_013418 [Lonicera macranthoides]
MCVLELWKRKNKAKCDGMVLSSATLIANVKENIRDRYTRAAILTKCARSEIAMLKESGLLNLLICGGVIMLIRVPLLPEHLNMLPLDPPEPFFRPFSLAEILSMTQNFNESLVIGQGGFGKVYKGIIGNKASVFAVKRLNSTSKQGDSEF